MPILILMAALLAAPAGPAPELEARIRTETLERAQVTAEPHRDETLAEIARSYSRTMHRVGELGHEVGAGVGPAHRVARHHRRVFALVSENVAVQQRWPEEADLARRFVAGWMSSPGHRANILAAYDTLEVGCFGNREAMYCTQLFLRDTTRLAEPVAFEHPPGTKLRLAFPSDSGPERRVSIAPVNSEPRGTGVPVSGGAARLPVPERPGRYQLELWTRQTGDGARYRVVDGPFVRVSRQP